MLSSALRAARAAAPPAAPHPARAGRGGAAGAPAPHAPARAAGASAAPLRACHRRRRAAAPPPPRAAAAASSSDAPPGAKGRMTYRPQSYNEIVQDAARAVQAAIKDGERLLEVEFPPLPASKDGAPRCAASGVWLCGRVAACGCGRVRRVRGCAVARRAWRARVVLRLWLARLR
jgi:hypothetical protein